MFCPQCKLEYREGFTVCTDCEIPLVESLAPEAEGDPGPLDLVTVLETSNPAVVSLAHSLLDEGEIAYITRGEGAQDLFGVGPVEIQVESGRAEEAKALLARIEEHPDVAEPAAPAEPAGREPEA